IRATLPASVAFNGHGFGIGVAFVDASSASNAQMDDACRLLSDDVVPFDQRGCLSPRIALVTGSEERVERFAAGLASALEAREKAIPRGRISAEEGAETVRYRDTMRFSGAVHAAGSAWVGVDLCGTLAVVPPPGRNVHVARSTDIRASVSP